MKTKILIVLMAVLSFTSVEAEDLFIVKDIRIEGLQKISEGALLNYLPVNICLLYTSDAADE